MTYLIVVVFLSVLGVSGTFRAIFEFYLIPSNGQNSKIARNAPETPRTLKNTTTIRQVIFISLFLTIFKQFTKSRSRNLIQSLINRTPSLGRLDGQNRSKKKVERREEKRKKDTKKRNNKLREKKRQEQEKLDQRKTDFLFYFESQQNW